jgi:hypothetical protein
LYRFLAITVLLDVKDIPQVGPLQWGRISLRASFAQPPDESDIKAYVVSETKARFAELDRFFKLKSDTPDIWERRGKALLTYQFDFHSDRSEQEWWTAFAYWLACRHVRGFTLKMPGEKKHGAPREWTFRRLTELFADVEFLKKKTGLSVSRICETVLRRKEYAKRWAQFGVDALRKAYSEAKKLRRENLLFAMQLSGPAAIIPAEGIDPIQAAIDLHSLKI